MVYRLASYKKYWHILGSKVTHMILGFLNNGDNIYAINDTPLKKNTTIVKDFLSISLCNVVYKLVSKIIVNRLRGCMTFVTHDSQSAVVEDRLIIDNFIIVSEAFYFMQHGEINNSNQFALKLDLSILIERSGIISKQLWLLCVCL